MDPRLMQLMLAYSQGARPPETGGVSPDDQMKIFAAMFQNTYNPQNGTYAAFPSNFNTTPYRAPQYGTTPMGWAVAGGGYQPSGPAPFQVAQQWLPNDLSRTGLADIYKNALNTSGWSTPSPSPAPSSAPSGGVLGGSTLGAGFHPLNQLSGSAGFNPGAFR